MGWNKPIKETLLGPIRNPTILKILRSIKVKKAILNINGKAKKTNLKKNKIVKMQFKGINHIKILNF